MADLPEVLQAVVVRPGDALIVRLGHPLSEDEAAEIRVGLTKLLPDTPVVLINAEEILVYRRVGGD